MTASTGADAGAPGSRGVRFGAWLLGAVAIVVADRGTKLLVEATVPPCTAAGCARIDVLPFLAWTHVCNPGAAFSFLAGAGGWQRWLFALVTLVVVPLLLVELWRLQRRGPGPATVLQSLGAAAIAGGALGNLWDRLAVGCVTDFVLVHAGGWSFPAFNVADSAISLGVAAWIVSLLPGLAGPRGDRDPEEEVRR